MLTASNLSAWRSVLDRVLRNGSGAGNGQDLRALRDRVNFLVDHPDEPREGIEADLNTVLVRHPDLVWDAAEQIMKELFQLVDAETTRLGAIKSRRALTDDEKAAGREYIAVLEQCDRILQDAKPGASRHA